MVASLRIRFCMFNFQYQPGDAQTIYIHGFMEVNVFTIGTSPCNLGIVFP